MSTESVTNYLQNVSLIKNSTVNNGTYVKIRKYAPAPFTTIPLNVLIKIFEYFNEDELRKYIIPVCQQWRYTAMQPSLWKKLKIKGFHVPTDYACCQIRCFTKITFLSLDHVAEPTEILRQLCRTNTNLKNLTVRNCSGIREITLRHVVKCCKFLEKFDLQGTQFKGNLFFAELGGLKYLISLNVSENHRLTLNNLLTIVLNCRNLEDLKISKLKISEDNEQLCDEDLSFIMANMSSALKCFELDTSNLTDLAFQKIFSCKNLERLGLFRAANLSGDVFSTIWKNLSKVTKLRVSYANHISGEHVAALFTEGKHVMQHLELLDLTGCYKVSDSSLKAIADCCPNLKHVTLKCCKSISDVSHLLEKCNEIQHFNIAFCNKIKMNKILPLPKQINTLIIDENNKNKDILEDIKDHHNVKVYISLSEYNTCTDLYN